MKGGPFRCPPFDSSVAAEGNYLTLKVVTIPSWMCRGTSQTTWIVPRFLKMIFSVALPPGRSERRALVEPMKSMLCATAPAFFTVKTTV